MATSSTKRPRGKRHSGLSAAAERLIRLAGGLAESGCRIEEQYWEKQLADAIDQLLEEGREDILTSALDYLYKAPDPEPYEALYDLTESCAECAPALREREEQVVLIAAPALAWSRYNIPATTIPASAVANLRVHLQAHVLAKNVRLAVADFFFSPDQIPQGYVPTAQLAAALGEAALDGQDMVHIEPDTVPPTEHFLSDIRYLIAAVAVPRGAPIFIWQEENGGSREQAASQWAKQGGACITPLFPGCALEFVLPETYFAASSRADEASRPHSLRASVSFLGMELDVPAANLRAVIAPFRDRDTQEYRIGFTLRGQENVLHGVVWPLLGADNSQSDIPSEIEKLLREAGVNDIVQLEHTFPLEYCEDCSAPLYPSPDSDLVHAEMPEPQGDATPRVLH